MARETRKIILPAEIGAKNVRFLFLWVLLNKTGIVTRRQLVELMNS